jgi:hypothetical protein
MPIQTDGAAPYAPPHTITAVIEAYRNRGLATPFTVDVLVRAGVTESLAPRTLLSLKGLDLIDDDGNPTDQFEALRRARGEEEYKTRLQEWLRAVYADVLQFTDPATDDADRVAEAFRGYNPAGQRTRMVTLMLGMFEYAGLVSETPKRQPSPRRPAAQRPKKASPPGSLQQRRREPPAPDVEGLPPALVGLLKQIPRGSEGWTKARREEFLKAFAAVLDFSVPVVDGESTFDPWQFANGEGEGEDDKV